ncbi:MAG: ankyrin repeat domain-containing protein [Fusobacterium sp. JB021]|nr:ankyrin repeat domain-containing protein [Fusobacterium sp. JB021]MDP0507352.1 ankyrin repeat domain-containing protein [Fusobacterium sp. JB019]
MELLTFLENNDLENFEENLSISAVEETDNKGNTILHFAVLKKKINFVEVLLYHGADPNIENKKEETPLHIAARLDFDQIFELLLKYGADLRQENDFDQLPKDIAEENHSKKVLKIIENVEEE